MSSGSDTGPFPALRRRARPTHARHGLVGGTDLAGLSDHRLTTLRRELIGFVFQEFNLVSALTAAQNVALPLRLAGRPAPLRTTFCTDKQLSG